MGGSAFHWNIFILNYHLLGGFLPLNLLENYYSSVPQVIFYPPQRELVMVQILLPCTIKKFKIVKSYNAPNVCIYICTPSLASDFLSTLLYRRNREILFPEHKFNFQRKIIIVKTYFPFCQHKTAPCQHINVSEVLYFSQFLLWKLKLYSGK